MRFLQYFDFAAFLQYFRARKIEYNHIKGNEGEFETYSTVDTPLSPGAGMLRNLIRVESIYRTESVCCSCLRQGGEHSLHTGRTSWIGWGVFDFTLYLHVSVVPSGILYIVFSDDDHWWKAGCFYDVWSTWAKKRKSQAGNAGTYSQVTMACVWTGSHSSNANLFPFPSFSGQQR